MLDGTALIYNMGLLHITTIAFVVQLYVAGGVNLPRLPGNRLLTGHARDLPGAIRIWCEGGPLVVATYKTTHRVLNPSTALSKSKFQSNPFTARPVLPGPLDRPLGGVGRFSFMEVKPQSGPKPTLVYGLQLDGTGRTGESAYWLPQGGHIDIPAVVDHSVTPSTKYVFTPDFSGCSWTVTPMADGNLRIRHVQGDHEDQEFNNLSEADKGGPVTYAMQYTDYGYLRKHGQLFSNVAAYAYMHFTNGRWEIHLQNKPCAPTSGNCRYDRNNLLDTMKMYYYDQRDYNMISGTMIFTVPNGH